MARFIGPAPENAWERQVRNWIDQQAPKDWIVLTNVAWSVVGDGRFVRDGEADLVVLVPNSGLVVLEVKGSREFKVSENGDWHRLEGEEWIKIPRSPAVQASEAMHVVVGEVSKAFPSGEFPGRFAYIVVYPNGKATSLPTMHDESTLATSLHRNQLASRIRHALEKRGPEALGRKFDENAMSRVVAHLKDTRFHVTKVDTSEEVDVDARAIEQLTRQQAAALRGIFLIPRVAIMGPAGSGKTLLAVWRLQTLAAEGKRAIYACYNRALADALKLRNPSIADSIWNVDRLFQSVVPRWQEALRGDLNRFFREDLPGLADDAIAGLAKYDAVIVDEGQDFSESQLLALLSFVSDEGTWSFFADWEQDLFKVGMKTPLDVEVVFNLFHNCRNTVKINDASNRLLGMRVESMPGLPTGTAPLVEYAKSPAARAWELASQWAGEGSVAFLSPYKLENSALSSQRKGHGLELTAEISRLGEPGFVYFSTIKAFKGIEATSIIVVDVSEPGASKAFEREDLYVACTRATSRLALLVTREDSLGYYSPTRGNPRPA